MKGLKDKAKESVRFIREKTNLKPQIGLVLGTGLGSIAESIELECSIPYSMIPHFPVSTVEGHKGELLFGKWNDKNVVIMSGRFHFYEGYSTKQVGFPILVLQMLGIDTILISNVTGSLNEKIKAGELVVIKDHIYLISENPLRGENDETLGPRFPDMLETYNEKLREICKGIKGFGKIHEGVYLCTPGPSLETAAEYKYMQKIGGDVVGMSSIPEVIVAQYLGLKICMVSACVNEAFPIENLQKTTIESVLKVANEIEPRIAGLLDRLIRELP